MLRVHFDPQEVLIHQNDSDGTLATETTGECTDIGFRGDMSICQTEEVSYIDPTLGNKAPIEKEEAVEKEKDDNIPMIISKLEETTDISSEVICMSQSTNNSVPGSQLHGPGVHHR